MAELGTVQVDDVLLRERARRFALPDEAEDARRIVAELRSAIERVAQVHVFGKGMGIAAPQIGHHSAVGRLDSGEGKDPTPATDKSQTGTVRPDARKQLTTRDEVVVADAAAENHQTCLVCAWPPCACRRIGHHPGRETELECIKRGLKNAEVRIYATDY